MSEANAAVEKILECINRETRYIDTNERAMALLLVMELIKCAVELDILDTLRPRKRQTHCRDCAHWGKNGYCYKHAYEVTRFTEYDEELTEDEGIFAMNADDYCSLAERREGDA